MAVVARCTTQDSLAGCVSRGKESALLGGIQ